MRCSGGSKCNCALFQGGHRAKRCKSCHHDRGSHYEPGSDDDDDDDDDDDESSGNDRDDKDGDDNDNGNAKQPSIRMKNKMTVSSLVANLINDGERSRVEVENAEREAKAGLTRRQVGFMLTELWSRNSNLQHCAVWVKAEGKQDVDSKTKD